MIRSQQRKARLIPEMLCVGNIGRLNATCGGVSTTENKVNYRDVACLPPSCRPRRVEGPWRPPGYSAATRSAHLLSCGSEVLGLESLEPSCEVVRSFLLKLLAHKSTTTAVKTGDKAQHTWVNLVLHDWGLLNEEMALLMDQRTNFVQMAPNF